jgi:hypothetical protein
MSAVFEAAIREWRYLRAEYEIYREGAYERAETECNGVLLNARAKKAGIVAYSLFMGPEVRAKAYASEELIEHWRRYPRLTFAEFEAQQIERGEYAA